MKTIAIALAATLFVSVAASAQSTEDYAGYSNFVATKTRAEVKAETLAAIQRGELRSGEQYPGAEFAVPAGQTSKTRAEVKAELAAYRNLHRVVTDDIATGQ
ncbi:DUF4148 domain-containing protein [Duganella sp. BuS-21]|uniref:DUF4148 domain-containing protein n=1 Tax=Duganella sp. BuS-21 TaxID=2943848 RepID=UPI0035A6DE0D